MNSSSAYFLTDLSILTIASNTVNVILSLPVNTCVAWLIASGSRSTLVGEFFPLNLAVYEILFCLLSFSSIHRVIADSGKHLSVFSQSFLWSGRPVLQCCICIEQFLAVMHPVLYLRYKRIRYKVAFSGLAWTVVFGLSVFYTIAVGAKHLVFAGECVLVVSVMLFCYFSVLVALRKPEPGDGKRRKNNTIKRRAFFTILLITVSFIGTYLFWCVFIFSNQKHWVSHFRRIFTRVCICISFATGLVQPLFYLQRSKKICHCKAV